uniref:NEDD4-like E3 ubiquitin-protein ligase WWP1 n=1 Tax=Lygus hesperus TaxID=30085 RepID=A0A0A9WME7_LYGHE
MSPKSNVHAHDMRGSTSTRPPADTNTHATSGTVSALRKPLYSTKSTMVSRKPVQTAESSSKTTNVIPHQGADVQARSRLKVDLDVRVKSGAKVAMSRKSKTDANATSKSQQKIVASSTSTAATVHDPDTYEYKSKVVP